MIAAGGHHHVPMIHIESSYPTQLEPLNNKADINGGTKAFLEHIPDVEILVVHAKMDEYQPWQAVKKFTGDIEGFRKVLWGVAKKTEVHQHDEEPRWAVYVSIYLYELKLNSHGQSKGVTSNWIKGRPQQSKRGKQLP
jgi:hypothetical protein